MAKARNEPSVDPSDATAAARNAAAVAGLVYVSDEQPGISRRRAARYFSYRAPDGATINDRAERDRIRKLAVPPAYTEVWICADPRGHIQATGRDAKGRKQYRYHDRFRAVRDATKYTHMLDFAAALPRIRDTVDGHMRQKGLPREKVLATVVRLLESTMIRVGNADYARQNKSFGLTTLRKRHVAVEGSELRFDFKGKSGKRWRLGVKDRRVARIVKAIHELPGQHLFQYVDDEGGRRDISSSDINSYLREAAGADISAKDFRTWMGTVIAANTLAELDAADSEAAARKNIRDAVRSVASVLGNTPTVCRKCYIHPEIFDSYAAGALALDVPPLKGSGMTEGLSGLEPEEALVYAFLKRRLAMSPTAAKTARKAR